MIWLNDYDLKILFIPFFLYFIIVRKSIRTVKKENDGINGNKEISFGSSKKSRFLIQSMGEDNGHSGIRRCSVLGKTSHKWLYQIFDMLTYHNENTI